MKKKNMKIMHEVQLKNMLLKMLLKQYYLKQYQGKKELKFNGFDSFT